MRLDEWASKLAAPVKAAVVAVTTAVAGPPPRPAPNRDAREELQRRADVNARAAATRADREATFFGRSRWFRARSGWMNRGR